jgi:hypothetical protein
VPEPDLLPDDWAIVARASAHVAQTADGRLGLISQSLEGPLEGAGQGRRFVGREEREGVGEHGLADVEDPAREPSAGETGRERDGRPGRAATASDEPLLGEPIDDAHRRWVRETDRSPELLDGEPGKPRDRHQRRRRCATVPDGGFGLGADPVGERDSERAQEVLQARVVGGRAGLVVRPNYALGILAREVCAVHTCPG